MLIYLCDCSNIIAQRGMLKQPFNIEEQIQMGTVVACIISPPFIIRSKKPIVQPGIKKRKASQSINNDVEGENIVQQKNQENNEQISPSKQFSSNLLELDLLNDNSERSQKIRKIENDKSKVQECINLFREMSEEERKNALNRMMDELYAHEKEFIFRYVFFFVS